MNINEYKKYLQSINNTLDNASQNYQMRERLSESPVCDMKEYKPDGKKDKSSHAPTTAAGDSLRPHSKKSDAPKKLKEDEDIIEIPECVQQYFENYFGDNLTEDTDDEDIIKAVEDLVDLCEAVCDAVGLDEGVKKMERMGKAGKLPLSKAKAEMEKQAQRLYRDEIRKGPDGDIPDYDENMHKIASAWQKGQPKTRTHKKGLGRVYKDYGTLDHTRSMKNKTNNPTGIIRDRG